MKLKTKFEFKQTRISLCLLAALSTYSVQAEEAQRTKDAEIERVTVIGSNIKRATDVNTLPVTALTAADIENSAAMSGDELLRSIPQMGSVNFGETTGSSNVNDARGDVGSFNLRGLGAGNTLVLLNGRRMVNHPGTQSKSGANKVPVNTVNSNTLPVSGLRSLEVLRDGAAAVYGSDAIAGVVNYALDSEYVGSKLSLRYGQSEGTPLDETTFSYLGGIELNDGRSNLVGSVTIYDRNGMMATERAYSASHDRRDYPGLPEEFIGDSQLDNRSSDTPWGEFNSDSLGTFHLQPDSLSGCVDSALDVEGVCVDQGSTGQDIRFDRGTTRPLSSDAERVNFYTHFTHEVNDNVEFFSEGIYYQAELTNQSEQNHNGSKHRFNIAADAFYNPFDEEVLLRRFRPTDIGPRTVTVKDTSFRVLAGFKGYIGDWDWESAAFYSEAETNDQSTRIDVNAFEKAVNSTDESTAYNVFGGGDINNPNTIGERPLVAKSISDQFLIQAHTDSETSLASIDFKASNSEFFAVPAGDAGIALGVEFRRETYDSDRSKYVDGSLPFTDYSGVINESSLYGSSATTDSNASRNVGSAFAELILPLIDNGDQYAEVQLAARYENFSDAGDAFKPKVALFYKPTNWLSLRASYAGGFKVPGLQQSSEEASMPRRSSEYDPVTDSTYAVIDNRQGNSNLKPEDSVNTSLGLIFNPIENLTFTVDYWKIEQENLVFLAPYDTVLAHDYVLRQDGGTGNSNVIRDEELVASQVNNKYINASSQELSGLDFGLVYDLETSFGDFEFNINAAKLTKYETSVDSLSALVLDAQQDLVKYPNLADVEVAGVGDLIKQDGNPEWRAKSSLNWRLNGWGAGVSVDYVSEFIDTSTNYTSDEGEKVFLPIDSMTTVNVYGSHKFSDESSLEGLYVRLGVRNIGDEEPPLADNFWHGYSGDYHSNRGRYFYINLSKTF
ncbi:TonB-dependent receptor domain-containing protein [Cognaticolwellia beringensis]|uniref:TonB-dependent receptor n=1 Tax=Cognaticolwellia beringensis TaxID=1967665 RepID=A0A222G9L3_9GAMM|nr:TonB-dependent receptor [Cognaticolwellia beringensis]ASP48586.1 TonB-dependent receptor [Cognaticolwellia beringensis]